MTTTILATIGIVLAAAAALMTMFYGGGMYGDGVVTAKADTVAEAGKNVVAGYNTYELRNGSPPSDPEDLVSGTGGGILTGMPSVGGVGDVEPHWVGLDRGRGLERAFAVRDVPDDVCGRINHVLAGSDAVPSTPDRDVGCFKGDNGVAVYYAFVGPMTQSDPKVAYVAARTGS